MKKIIRSWIAFAVSLLLLLLCWMLETNLKSRQTTDTDWLSRRQTQVLASSEQHMEALLGDTALNNPLRLCSFDPTVGNRYKASHLGILVYFYDSLVYWSDNRLSVDSCLGDIAMGSSIMKTQNGYYQVYKKISGYYTYLCFYLVKQEISAQNDFLANQLNGDFGIQDQAEIALAPMAGFTNVFSGQGKYLYSVRLLPSYRTPLYLLLLIVVAVLFTIISFEVLVRVYNRRRQSLWVTLLLCNFIITLRLVTIIYHFPQFVYDQALFSSGLYASNRFFASLGDYVINVMFVGRCMFLLFSSHDLKTLAKPGGWRWLGTGAMAAVVYVACSGIQSLVIDSRIAFDVNNQLLSGHTLMALAAMCLTVLCVVLCLRIFLTLFPVPFVHGQRRWLLAIIIAGLPFTLLVSFAWAVLLQALIFLLALLLATTWRRWKNPLQTTLVQAAVSALFVSLLLVRCNAQKEADLRRLMAENSLTQSDRKAENLLLLADKKIGNEFMAFSFFESPLVTKKMLEKRLREEYFNGYMNRFEVYLLDYDPAGAFFKEKSIMPLADIDSIYRIQATPLAGTHFSRINTPGEAGGYLGRFRFAEKGSEVGLLYILLQPRSFQTENSFSEILSEKRKPVNNYNYSWAIYKNGSLFNSRGTYNFQTTFNGQHGQAAFVRFQENGYSHLVYNVQPGLSVQVSLEHRPLSSFFITFTFLFTYFLLLVFVMLFLSRLLIVIQYLPVFWHGREVFETETANAIANDRLTGGMNLGLLATRIQFALVFMVFFTLIITVVLTQQSAKRAYNQRQVEKLLGKTRSITTSLESNMGYAEAGPDIFQLKGNIDRLSELNNADINLFDAAGSLVKTTQPKIFESGIISPKLHPEALYQLRHQGASRYFQNEAMGSLHYVSAYMPVFYQNQRVAYVNIPFFSKQAELDAELRANLISLMGPYSLIFVLVGILAWLISSRFTARLSIIREYLGRTDLMHQNPRIHWQSNDEIGELVKQYNLMLDKLAESAEELAKTERDQAWREMAKQIAHEIKNPLTPMKLNVQMLQKAWDDKSPNMDEAIRKTSKLLVEQIDSLANLATSFGNFAQMPESRVERVQVNNTLKAAAALFDTEAAIEINTGPDATIHIDKDEWNRVLNNLLKNAIQAATAEQHPVIRIESSLSGSAVLICIADNGTGIPPDIQDRVFEPNFSTKNSGMGLGLAMVKKIIVQAGGEIWFETTHQKGTTFFIRFNTV